MSKKTAGSIRDSTIKKIKIKMCDVCNGTGVVITRELTDYHRGEYSYEENVCEKCAGFGRLRVTKKIETTVEPYRWKSGDDTKLK